MNQTFGKASVDINCPEFPPLGSVQNFSKPARSIPHPAGPPEDRSLLKHGHMFKKTKKQNTGSIVFADGFVCTVSNTCTQTLSGAANPLQQVNLAFFGSRCYLSWICLTHR